MPKHYNLPKQAHSAHRRYLMTKGVVSSNTAKDIKDQAEVLGDFAWRIETAQERRRERNQKVCTELASLQSAAKYDAIAGELFDFSQYLPVP